MPALPSATTWGESFDHALEMARDVIELTLDVMHAEHEPLPDDVIDLPDGIDLRYAMTLHFNDPAEHSPLP